MSEKEKAKTVAIGSNNDGQIKDQSADGTVSELAQSQKKKVSVLRGRSVAGGLWATLSEITGGGRLAVTVWRSSHV